MASRSIRWLAQSLLWKQWPDEPVVYNTASGNTHLISPIAAKILRQLEQQASTALELAEKIACEFDVESDSEVVANVERMIRDLDDLGLVTPLSD